METHIGKKIEARAKELRIGPTELGEKINTSRQNMLSIYKRQSVDALVLWKLSKALNYNLFVHYPLPGIEIEQNASLLKEMGDLKKEIQILKKEVQTLEDKNALLTKINSLLEKGNKKQKP